MATDQTRYLTTKYYKLERLLNWEHVEAVNEMLLDGISPHKVEAFCKTNGFSISHPKLYEYKDLLQKAISQQVSVAQMLGIGNDFQERIQENISPEQVCQITSDMAMLDKIIQRGFNVASNVDSSIKLSDAMRAIEMKNKLSGSMNLSQQQVTQLKELEEAKFAAVIEVVKKYIPEDKYEELTTAIEEAETNFYKAANPELLKEYEKHFR